MLTNGSSLSDVSDETDDLNQRAVKASTDQIVEQLNLVGGTLDQIDASEDAESADALIDRGLDQAINALFVLAEQPVIADEKGFAANLPQPAVDAEAVDQYLAEVLHNPDEFAADEARLVADSGGQPGPSARVEQHLISHIIDVRSAQNVQVDDNYASASPEQVREAAEKLNRAKSLTKHRRKKLRLLIRSFQMLAGAVVTLVDIPAAAAAAGVISMALGTGMVVDAYSKIVDEVLPDDE